ncbi:HBL358Cp [Eremothecium sinecaudum]|uniref:HBL358Cp n=1 Tax=Eremothecium sinecaudum TaxID=45286 RepID=A0A120K0P2_9SACH|nr:HBL358Cp [Eremothecium sinecaudum]AMD18544.1 HBL358Cp [Eremothecium sinecaudum]
MCARKLKYSSGDELPLFATPVEAMREGTRQEDRRRRQMEYQAPKYGGMAISPQPTANQPGVGSNIQKQRLHMQGNGSAMDYHDQQPYQQGGHQFKMNSQPQYGIPPQQHQRMQAAQTPQYSNQGGRTQSQPQSSPYVHPPHDVYSHTQPPRQQVHSQPQSYPQAQQQSFGHGSHQNRQYPHPQSQPYPNAPQGQRLAPAHNGNGQYAMPPQQVSRPTGVPQQPQSMPPSQQHLQPPPTHSPMLHPSSAQQFQAQSQSHSPMMHPSSAQHYALPSHSNPGSFVNLPSATPSNASGPGGPTSSTEDQDAVVAKRLFQNHDSRKLERLTAEELQNILQNDDNTQFCMSSVNALINLFGASRFGTVNLPEFTSLYKRVKKWRMVYVDNDINGSFTISVTEFHNSLQELGYLIPFEVADKLFQQYSEYMNNNKHTKELKFDKFVEALVWLMRLTKTFRTYDTRQDGVATIHFKDFIETSLYLGKFLPR